MDSAATDAPQMNIVSYLRSISVLAKRNSFSRFVPVETAGTESIHFVPAAGTVFIVSFGTGNGNELRSDF